LSLRSITPYDRPSRAQPSGSFGCAARRFSSLATISNTMGGTRVLSAPLPAASRSPCNLSAFCQAYRPAPTASSIVVSPAVTTNALRRDKADAVPPTGGAKPSRRFKAEASSADRRSSSSCPTALSMPRSERSASSSLSWATRRSRNCSRSARSLTGPRSAAVRNGRDNHQTAVANSKAAITNKAIMGD